MNADSWYLADALARLRTGWRVRYREWEGEEHADGYRVHYVAWVIYGPFGDVGICDNPESALAYYQLQCSLGPQVQPARVWPRDMLPFDNDPVTHDRHERTASDGVETADARYDGEHRA